MAGCGGGSPCDLVLNSRWSMLAGVLPVSGLAFGVYLAILTASFFIGPITEVPVRRLAWRVMLILAGSVAGSAIWFTIVQKWIIGDFCLYCMTTHTTGFLLAVLITWRVTKEFDTHTNITPQPDYTQNISSATAQRIIRPLHALSSVLIGLILSGILAAGQISFTPASTYREGESKDNLPAISYQDVPMVGFSDAPYIIDLLFDYQCPHCQQLHLMLNEVTRLYNGKVAFVLCPTPLNSKCNHYIPSNVDTYKNSCELAKIGLAVWVAKHETFSVFDNWMFTFDTGNIWHPRSPDSARAKAIELVGQEEFDAAWSDPWIEQYLQTCVEKYGKTIQSGNGGVPKLVLGSRWVIPEPNNAEDLIMILQKSLSVPYP